MIEIGAHPDSHGALILHSTESGRFLPCERDEVRELLDALDTDQAEQSVPSPAVESWPLRMIL